MLIKNSVCDPEFAVVINVDRNTAEFSCYIICNFRKKREVKLFLSSVKKNMR